MTPRAVCMPRTVYQSLTDHGRRICAALVSPPGRAEPSFGTLACVAGQTRSIFHDLMYVEIRADLCHQG